MGPADRHLPDPKARTLWTATGAAAGAAIALPVAVVLFLLGAWWLGLLMVLAVSGAGALFGRALWARRTWRLGPEAVEIRRGLVIQRSSFIPYHRIQQIDVARGPLERLVGLAQLVMRTAAATTDATVIGLTPAAAERLRTELLERADVDDTV